MFWGTMPFRGRSLFLRFFLCFIFSLYIIGAHFYTATFTRFIVNCNLIYCIILALKSLDDLSPIKWIMVMGIKYTRVFAHTHTHLFYYKISNCRPVRVSCPKHVQEFFLSSSIARRRTSWTNKLLKVSTANQTQARAGQYLIVCCTCMHMRVESRLRSFRENVRVLRDFSIVASQKHARESGRLL